MTKQDKLLHRVDLQNNVKHDSILLSHNSLLLPPPPPTLPLPQKKTIERLGAAIVEGAWHKRSDIWSTVIAETPASDKKPHLTLIFFHHQAGGEDFEDNHRLSVSDTLTSSDQHPDDYRYTCQFTIQLPGIAENRYTVSVLFYPPLSEPPASTIKFADAIPVLDLSKAL